MPDVVPGSNRKRFRKTLIRSIVGILSDDDHRTAGDNDISGTDADAQIADAGDGLATDDDTARRAGLDGTANVRAGDGQRAGVNVADAGHLPPFDKECGVSGLNDAAVEGLITDARDCGHESAPDGSIRNSCS
jgi:hypothetical protein